MWWNMLRGLKLVVRGSAVAVHCVVLGARLLLIAFNLNLYPSYTLAAELHRHARHGT
jgi:hypothetical protein